ncbi:hypothetical protein CPB86DRAFT_784345 [Serendipita vermifera]|nr:hypothetical protein CPB86DRAFT_784345 [Serendipita vermifera]
MSRITLPSFKTISVDNVGSEARDFCAIERTYLSHIRLGMLLSLLSAALMLNARLPTPGQDPSHHQDAPLYTIPLASAYLAASICGLSVACYNYERLWKGLKDGAAFVQSSRIHTAAMSLISLLIIGTIITLLARAR